MTNLLKFIVFILCGWSLLGGPAHALSCNGNVCPEGLGSIEFGTHACFGVLVEEDIVLTLKHCLPQSYQIEGKRLPFFVTFPKTKGKDTELARVTEVVDVSGEVMTEYDFAFLRIGPLKEPRLPIEWPKNFESGPKELSVLASYYFDSSDEKILKRFCQLGQNSIARPKSSSVMGIDFTIFGDKDHCLLLDDEAINYAGSPILDKNGRLLGLVKGHRDYRSSTDGKFFGIVQSIHCINSNKVSSFKRNVPEICFKL